MCAALLERVRDFRRKRKIHRVSSFSNSSDDSTSSHHFSVSSGTLISSSSVYDPRTASDSRMRATVRRNCHSPSLPEDCEKCSCCGKNFGAQGALITKQTSFTLLRFCSINCYGRG